MICYIVTETREKYDEMDCHAIKHDLEKLSGDLCLVMHFSQVTREFVDDVRPWAICHSGKSTPLAEYDLMEHEQYRWLITESGVPQIGFCGGKNIIVEMFGGSTGRMRELRPDEPDLAPQYRQGWFKEWGVWPIEIVADDPLFAWLDSPIRVWVMHCGETTMIPEGFRLLASSADCRVQALVHEELPLYGTQFHPEKRQEGYPDGFRVLSNFFDIAREHHASQSRSPGGTR